MGIAAGGPSYLANGTDFNGTFKLNSSSALASDTQTFTLSTWFNPRTQAGARGLFQSRTVSFGSNISAINLEVNATSVNLQVSNSFGSGIFTSTGHSINVNVWNHFLVSYDGASNTRHVYFNGTSRSSTGSTGTIPLSSSFVDAYVGGSFLSATFDGSLSEFYFTNSYIDLSLLSNREKFSTSSGLPVSLGASGEIPTGSTPLIYFTFNFPDLGSPVGGDNLGTVSTFAANGSGAADGGQVTSYL